MSALFVYGTLAPGEENAHIMNGMDGIWHKASVRGHRVSTGWGTQKGHPGFVPDPNGDLITGLVFISDDLPQQWQRLDKFEGADYHRVQIEVVLEDGQTIKAHTYRVFPAD